MDIKNPLVAASIPDNVSLMLGLKGDTDEPMHSDQRKLMALTLAVECLAVGQYRDQPSALADEVVAAAVKFDAFMSPDEDDE